ncbi:23S rRNA (pseudouridine(1915)-N(3))-methyltransferase RlmH [Aureimonas leprariae]|uniref:Ribosomal RNA large subunit methyltransferase H n=1 Tax=Plantimonas leprariae TaxID=2615207 RepID=A0A7V7TXP1_9HYPH|nr:23S rRNA (pseudouridine(1915)-N(3))-methyltransferase RlmH [Aureimonas leprariae]KAB0681295.1 23S rRNA (pseudouridine(1915)-N(3))-methyltransferase RlmH [Aureimonas leprariae]
MRLSIAAVGRMKAGPERELAARYLDRLRQAGRPIGLDYAGLAEEAEGRGTGAPERKRDEAARLLSHVPDRGAIVLLDEGGKVFASQGFAERLGSLRDEGLRDLVFLIGGPDGLDPDLKTQSRFTLALGAMTWPHQIARILLAEQLYRAVTILSGHPYHRE